MPRPAFQCAHFGNRRTGMVGVGARLIKRNQILCMPVPEYAQPKHFEAARPLLVLILLLRI